MQTLGIFKQTALGLEGSIRTLHIDLKLCVIKADSVSNGAEEKPDYVIKSKYSTIGHGWNETGDVNTAGNVMGSIRLEFREPFRQTSFEAKLSQRKNDWVMEWDSSPPEYTPILLAPFKRIPQDSEAIIEHSHGDRWGKTHGA